MFQCTADTANGALCPCSERRGGSTQWFLMTNSNSTEFSIYTSICSRFSEVEEVVPSLWAVLVIQGASELPVAQLHGRDETKSLTLSGLLSHGSHTGKVYLYIFFYRVIY